MYAKDKTLLIDRREMLRVKLKSLAEEARIIRREERRAWGVLRDELHQHRVRQVRSEARHTHLAYGFLRGKTYQQIEPSGSYTLPDWNSVAAMLKKYGVVGAPAIGQSALLAWRNAADVKKAA